MGESIQIGLKEVYEKLCSLEDRLDHDLRSTAVTLATLHLRIEHLEDQVGRRWQVYTAIGSALVSITIMVITLLAR